MISLRAHRLLGAENAGPWVSIEGETIAAVGPEPLGEPIDLGPVDLLPGLIDLHADTLAKKVFPRPSTELPLEAGLIDFDLEAVAYGITTPFLCVAFEEDSTKHRSVAQARRIVETAASLVRELVTDVRLHLRVDVTGEQTSAVAAETAAAHPDLVGLISYMDHTPGQGQYPDEAQWRASYGSADGIGDTELDQRLAAKRAGAGRTEEGRRMLADVARRHGYALAAHDDDSAAAVADGKSLGARISEFPVNREAAEAARATGLGTVMGAPNARRGRSHLTNLSARDALEAGCLDALASDYHPPSMLAAVYQLAATYGWDESVALVTYGPARLAGLTDRGRIAAGQRADLVAVSPGDWPTVRATWIRGREVFRRGAALEVRA
jgi:alpha-D-ribose 1-methylphosphonate 5-triphosphate diphosphatase